MECHLRQFYWREYFCWCAWSGSQSHDPLKFAQNWLTLILCSEFHGDHIDYMAAGAYSIKHGPQNIAWFVRSKAQKINVIHVYNESATSLREWRKLNIVSCSVNQQHKLQSYIEQQSRARFMLCPHPFIFLCVDGHENHGMFTEYTMIHTMWLWLLIYLCFAYL